MKKLTKKQKVWTSIGSIFGIAALTTTITTPIVVIEQNAYNNSAARYINPRYQLLIKDSETVKIYT